MEKGGRRIEQYRHKREGIKNEKKVFHNIFVDAVVVVIGDNYVVVVVAVVTALVVVVVVVDRFHI